MLELLHDVSAILNGGQKYFNQLRLLDGTLLEPDITKIPDDCYILIVSKVPDEELPERHKFLGLKGNIYDVKDQKDADLIKNMKVRKGITSKIDSWFSDQLKSWNEITPSIQTLNKIEELKMQLHAADKLPKTQSPAPHLIPVTKPISESSKGTSVVQSLFLNKGELVNTISQNKASLDRRIATTKGRDRLLQRKAQILQHATSQGPEDANDYPLSQPMS